MSAAEAGEKLDDLVYERVLATVDLDALFMLEQELWCALSHVGVNQTIVPDCAKALIDSALARLVDEPSRYSKALTEAEYQAELEDCDRIEREIQAKLRAQASSR